MATEKECGPCGGMVNHNGCRMKHCPVRPPSVARRVQRETGELAEWLVSPVARLRQWWRKRKTAEPAPGYFTGAADTDQEDDDA